MAHPNSPTSYPTTCNIDQEISFLQAALVQATISSIPRYNPAAKKKKRPPKARSPEIQAAAKLSKHAWWIWKCDGAPQSDDHPAVIDMKNAKRNLRKAQRKFYAKKRCSDLEEIMTAVDDATFYKLVSKQRSSSNHLTSCLVLDERKLTTSEEITEGWAQHFEALAIPKEDARYDDAFLNQANEDLHFLQKAILDRGDTIQPIDSAEVEEAVAKLNNNKAADYMGLTAEHLKFGGGVIYPALARIINSVFKQQQVPPSLKKGVITPVHKKGNIQNPDNYRGITVTSIILKVLEHVLSARHRTTLLKTQSILQSGFTKGTSSIKSAFLVTECQLEAKSRKEQLTLITLDTRKAFDVVNHNILLRNLLLDGIDPAEWMLLCNLYNSTSSSVKWQGRTSAQFDISQGVRQGGVLSTEHYKRYNNPLLLSLEDKFKGARIGLINIPHTTCADDLALLTHNDWEMNLMLRTVEDFSRRHRYDINPTKSSCIIYNAKKQSPNPVFELEGSQIPLDSSTIHLGVHRDTKGKVNVKTKVDLGRRTAYSLMGAGFNGKNGLKQSIKAHLWSTFVVPRLLYGLEVHPYTQTDLKAIEAFQMKALKQIQHLADRTANAAAAALLGVLPISIQIHRNTLNLFFSIIQTPDTVEYKVAERQLAMKLLSDNSFFSRTRRLLLTYGLPSAYDLMQNTPSKEDWKNRLNKATTQIAIKTWKEEIEKKSSLKYINSDALTVGKPHHAYTSVRPNSTDIRRAEMKAKLLTGTYTLQSNRAVFNQYAVDPICRLCNIEAETREHFISRCPVSTTERDKCKERMYRYLTSLDREISKELMDNDDSFTQLILDCSHPRINIGYLLSEEEVHTIELMSREFIWNIHLLRCRELARGPYSL